MLSPHQGRCWMGEGNSEKIFTKAKRSPRQNLTHFFFLVLTMKAFWHFLNLNIVKIDVKLCCINFRDKSQLGRKALVQKRGRVSDGGDWLIFCKMGGPPQPTPSPPTERKKKKKPAHDTYLCTHMMMHIVNLHKNAPHSPLQPPLLPVTHTPVFPLGILSLGQFCKISQNCESSCTKMIASRLKMGSINKKKHLFLHIFTISVEPIFQVAGPISRHTTLKRTLTHTLT